MRLTKAAMCLLAGLLAASCGKEQTQPATPDTRATPLVMTTFYPTTYFAERIGGEHVEVVNPVPADADPIFWRPSDADLARYQEADLIIINGAEFEKWIATAALPRTRIIDTTADLDEPFITYETTTHSHGPGGDHTHEGIDGHTWVDPVTAMAQARAIVTALAERFPDHADDFRARAEALMSDLASLDTRWRNLAPRLREATLLASHPAYNYVARRYQLDIANLDLDPEAVLEGDAIHDIEHAIEGASGEIVLMWEGEPRAETVERLSDEFGIASVWVSPAEARDASSDYIAVMNANLDRLEAALD